MSNQGVKRTASNSGIYGFSCLPKRPAPTSVGGNQYAMIFLEDVQFLRTIFGKDNGARKMQYEVTGRLRLVRRTNSMNLK